MQLEAGSKDRTHRAPGYAGRVARRAQLTNDRRHQPMTKKNAAKTTTPKTDVPKKDLIPLHKRIVKLRDGVYLIRPATPGSRAVPKLFQGQDATTGERFAVYTFNRKDEAGNWVPPVLDTHPEIMKERSSQREAKLLALPDEVRMALGY
jgi:hypothetical protein